MTSPNLIQQFDYGIAASELLQLKEKTPYPTLGDVVQPVLLVDDLRESGYQPKRRWGFAGQAVSIVGNTPLVWIKNGGSGNDRVVVDLIRIHAPSINQEQYFLSPNILESALGGMVPNADGNATLLNPTESEADYQGGIVPPRTGLTVTRQDRTVTGGLAGDLLITREANVSIITEIVGPFVIIPNRILALRGNSQNTVFNFEMYGHEYPG